MWKKDDPSQPEPKTPPRTATPTVGEARTTRSTSTSRATIGRSITIKGEVTGDEDLLIEGRVDGSVDLKKNSVTVGPDGTVKADIRGRVVIIEGKVEGDLRADEQVVLRSTARLLGDIVAPRLVLEDGASFRGGVDMGDTSTAEKTHAGTEVTSRPAKATSSKPAAESETDANGQQGTSSKPTAATA